MAEVPVRPVPPGGYAKFGESGARDATEITLTDLDEPGFELVYDAFGVSSQNRIRSLLEDTVAHLATEEAERGFVHPVIFITPGHYYNKTQNREIFHWDYTICDWLSDDGTLLSKAPPPPKIGTSTDSTASAAAPPWA